MRLRCMIALTQLNSFPLQRQSTLISFIFPVRKSAQNISFHTTLQNHHRTFFHFCCHHDFVLGQYLLQALDELLVSETGDAAFRTPGAAQKSVCLGTVFSQTRIRGSSTRRIPSSRKVVALRNFHHCAVQEQRVMLMTRGFTRSQQRSKC